MCIIKVWYDEIGNHVYIRIILEDTPIQIHQKSQPMNFEIDFIKKDFFVLTL